VFCPQCGTQAIAGAKFCAGCGTAISNVAVVALQEPQAALNAARSQSAGVVMPAVEETSSSSSASRKRLNPALLATAGLVVGGLIGFQMRPAVMFIGQLPFQTVITRGSGLRGIDQILISTAQQSFNVMFVAAVVGAVLAFGIAHLVNSRR
jgi:zinc-ribbon domain